MNITAVGKFLDQPVLISKLKDKTPKILIGAAFAYGIYDVYKTPKENRKNRAIKDGIILSATVSASLISAFGLKIGKKQLLKGLVDIKDAKSIISDRKIVIDKFLKKNNVDKKTETLLNRAKDGVINLKDTKEILKIGSKSAEYNELLDALYSKKENLSAKEIFKETGRLSVLGLMPVVSGVLGGIAAEKVTGENTPKTTSYKIKEGAYQFLANIFMCNVGAASALFGAEKLQKAGKLAPLSPIKKLGIIMGGIFVTGILGGSYAANFIGKKILDPIFDKKINAKEANSVSRFDDTLKSKTGKVFAAENVLKANKKDVYNERKPEILDMALHTDDIATAGVLSGFKWIEPMLPLMYTISGFRAGIGYRNNIKDTGR